MEPKKNPKADLTRNSGLYFAIGLVVVLLVTYVGLEWKKYDRTEKFDYTMNVNDQLDEDVPVTQMLNTPPPPPPPPQAPPVELKVVDDKEDVPETEIQSTETNQDEVIADVSDIAEPVEAAPPMEDVPFTVIENVPVFPGCENEQSNAAKRDCFQKKIMQFVQKNFHYPEIAQEMGIQGRVSVMFVIDEHGDITNVKMRGPDKSLEKAAKEIIDKLPKMTPGKQRGRAVRVPFSLPINFRLQ
ncbi:energy transducer TonB [Zhouia sp. PK063]|uniref:energy transducer TonB n=1 Tax=Zhouia sp. PK063 TaxID=3373602 RepID=UPI0037A1FC95